jgi:hypothetical protein
MRVPSQDVHVTMFMTARRNQGDTTARLAETVGILQPSRVGASILNSCASILI